MNRKLRNDAGITLIEILIGVVIVGIMASMAVPQFQTASDRLKFQGTARGINTTMNLARSMAVSTKDQYGVHFDDTTYVVTLFKDVVNVGGFDFAVGDSVVQTDTLDNTTVFLDTDCIGDVFIFQPNGSCSYSGGGIYVAMAYGEQLVSVNVSRVSATTGRVSSYTEYY